MTQQAAMRQAAVDFLADYKADADIKLTIYRARPRLLAPPHAFVDAMRGTYVFTGPTLAQETPEVDIVVVHGLFDSASAADQRDAFMDGFFEWTRTRFHEAGPNTLIAMVGVEDDPNYIPDWVPPEQQQSYYATRITMRGYAET